MTCRVYAQLTNGYVYVDNVTVKTDYTNFTYDYTVNSDITVTIREARSSGSSSSGSGTISISTTGNTKPII